MTASRSITFAAAVAASAVAATISASDPAAAAGKKAEQAVKAPPAQPSPAQPSPDATAAATIQAGTALALGQSVKLPLIRSELGWVKQCAGADGSQCILHVGFAAAPKVATNLELSTSLYSINGTHQVVVLLPLNLQLRPGFAITLGGTEAYLGTYSQCGLTGCYGDVMISDAVFDTMMKAKDVDVMISTRSNKTVALEGPLSGMAEAAAGPPMSAEDLKAAQARVVKILSDAEETSNKAQEQANQRPAGNVPPGTAPGPATTPTAPPTAETASEGSK